MGHKAGIGAIFGVVSEEGVAKPNSPVTLLDRENRKVIRRQLTREDGGFTFNGLNENEATYMAFVTDEDGAVPKNALIQDRILPVPAYSGATLWANWEYLCFRDRAQAVWSGDFVESAGQILPYCSQTLVKDAAFPVPCRLLGSGTSSLSVSEGPPGAPHIPMIRLQSRRAYMGLPAFPIASRIAMHSLECVVNLQSVSGVISLGASPARYNSSGRSGTWYANTHPTEAFTGRQVFYSQLRYTASSRELTIRYRHGTGSSQANNWQDGFSGTGTLVQRHHVFPVGEVPAGPVHIAYTLDPGVRLALFVNGVLVQDWDLLGESTFLVGPASALTASYTGTSGWSDGGFVWAGNPAADLEATDVALAEFGPFAWYPFRLLTDAEVVEHYEALMLPNVLPKLTGYVKEVITDRPGIYARLDDIQEDVTAHGNYQREFLRLAHPNWQLRLQQLTPASITVERPSPVVGGMSTQFTGGYLRGHSFFRAAPYLGRQASVEYFIQPVTTPGSEQIVRFNSGTTPMIWSGINASRQLHIGFRNSLGDNESYTFSHVLPDDEFTHVVITIDISTDVKELKLYIDGVLVETSPPAAVTGNTFAASVTPPSFGGMEADANFWVAGSAAGATTFKGHLCEVAFYGRALPAARVEAHYNARLIP
jgi:hypothetical protein